MGDMISSARRGCCVTNVGSSGGWTRTDGAGAAACAASSSPSSSSSSIGVTDGGGVGGRTAPGFDLRLSPLLLIGKIEPAQTLTVFARDFLLFFFSRFVFDGSAVSESDPRSEEETV